MFIFLAKNMKKCIVVLIDENTITRVNELIINLNTHFVQCNKNVDLLFFHEPLFPVQQITEVYNGGSIIFHMINLYDIDSEQLKNIPEKYYGFSLGYRMMCRFFSGTVFRILQTYNYEYLMRLDSDSSFYEIVNRDLFEEFISNDGYYGYINI
jgi:hypothetical protein